MHSMLMVNIKQIPFGHPLGINRELKQAMIAMPMRTLPNKRFNEKNNGCIYAL